MTDPSPDSPPEITPFWREVWRDSQRPEGPSDEAILAEATKFLCFTFAHMGDPDNWEGANADLCAFARAVLARWGIPNPITEELK